MDRYCPAGLSSMVLASFSFSIHPLIIYGVGGIVVLAALVFGVLKIRKGTKTRRYTRAQDRRDKVIRLLPAAWLDIYDQCMACEWSTRVFFFEEWFSRQGELPKLSIQAIELFSDINSSLPKKLGPFLAFKNEDATKKSGHSKPNLNPKPKYSPPRLSDYLADRLPKPWYQFALELIKYPSPRSLWIEKLVAAKHPCFQVPLTIEQSQIFAEAVGEDEHEIRHYAGDLAKFVSLKSESCDHDATRSDSSPNCPECGGRMILKQYPNRKTGQHQYYGCAGDGGARCKTGVRRSKRNNP